MLLWLKWQVHLQSFRVWTLLGNSSEKLISCITRLGYGNWTK